MTLWKVKEVNNKVEMSVAKTTQVVSLNSLDSLPKKKEESNPQKYVSKALFPQRLAKVKKTNFIGEIMEIFKLYVNIPLFDSIKKVPSYAKFFKDLCTKNKIIHVQKRFF